MSFHPVILCGGSGTRLWPASREDFPKPFSDLLEESLLQKTLKRVRRASGGASPWIITNRKLATLTRRLFTDAGFPVDQILLEPRARNTAAAIALITRIFEASGSSDEVIAIFPADHLIENEAAFTEALALAARIAASESRIVTLGITPHHPATGFGYLELGPEFGPSAGTHRAREALHFREKPSLDVARDYSTSGRHVWNAGIFVFRASVMAAELARHLPELWSAFRDLSADLSNLGEIYDRSPSISIDYGVMERASGVACIPCDPGWSDVGSWDEVASILDASRCGSLPERVVEVRAEGCTIVRQEPSRAAGIEPPRPRAIALVGVNDLIVVDTPDALLVTRKGETQAVREAQAALERAHDPVALTSTFEYRPWGYFEVIRDTARFKSKVIRVEPGHQLSYQSHAKRAEHWIILRGMPEVVLDDRLLKPRPGEHVFIPQGAKHRMRNPGAEPVDFVEVQVGEYFGEDDIVRHQDDYRRN